MAANVYAPPNENRSGSNLRRAYTLQEWMLGAGGVGVVSAGAFYVAYGLAFERLVMPLIRDPNAPFLSYGQAAAFLTLIAGALGMATGLSVALARYRHWSWSAFTAIGSALLTSMFVGSCWLHDIIEYGHDPSALILYVPFLVLIAIHFAAWAFTSLMIGLWRFVAE